ncbi:MAG: DUF4382 domain-containing protein, partial [Nitrososphaerota archaeon]|nr:DUF4382 domain-containing protein [Nitrososphaerota archaeon]
MGIVLLVAVFAIAAVALAPQLASPPTQTTPGTNTSTSSGGSQTSTSSSGSGTQGQMAVMATDPPETASGVQRAVVRYNDVAVHNEGSSSNNSGWTNFNTTGSIDLTASVNISKTIAVAKINAGNYNMIRLNITSATVTYQGQNYTATVRTGELTIHMRGNVQVNSSASSAALVDIRTFVVNSGNTTRPEFYVSASAVATAVPATDVTSATLQVGAKLDLSGRAWFRTFEDETSVKLVISQATLSANSLSLTLTNEGNASANIKTVIVTPVRASASANASLPPSFAGSAVFTTNGSEIG